jgi:hypothetical protein
MPVHSLADALKNVSSHLRTDVREKFPKACSAALSRTANGARDAMKQHIQSSFHNPTPYAVNAARAAPATVQTMASAVYLRDFGGTPAGDYLGPEIMGGARKTKRFERALSFIHALPSGGYAVPGAGATLNEYGNQTSGEIIKILSVLKAFGETGYRANRRTKWKGATRVGQIFVVRAGTNSRGLKPGVYKRTANGVVPLIKFLSKPPRYGVRLRFDELVKADAARIFPVELARAIEELRR